MKTHHFDWNPPPPEDQCRVYFIKHLGMSTLVSVIRATMLRSLRLQGPFLLWFV